VAFLNKFLYNSGNRKAETEAESIVSNLNNILNTKQDYGSFLNDFGIRDLNEFGSKDHIASAIIDEVAETITNFEPRVEMVAMKTINDPNPFRIAFSIECIIMDGRQTLRMVFDSVQNSFIIDNRKE
jgi:type VI secretion system protein